MSEEADTASFYRERARELRLKASHDPKARSRSVSLQLADEYEWRASSFEAAMRLRSEGETVFPRSVRSS